MPDAVDISLSDAVMRHGDLADLQDTVKRVFEIERNQPLVVSVGGRLFAEASAMARSVGADHARRSVAGSRVRLAELIRDKKQQSRRED